MGDPFSIGFLFILLRWRHKKLKFRRKLSLRSRSRLKKAATCPRKDGRDIYFGRRRFTPGATLKGSGRVVLFHDEPPYVSRIWSGV